MVNWIMINNRKQYSALADCGDWMKHASPPNFTPIVFLLFFITQNKRYEKDTQSNHSWFMIQHTCWNLQERKKKEKENEYTLLYMLQLNPICLNSKHYLQAQMAQKQISSRTPIQLKTIFFFFRKLIQHLWCVEFRWRKFPVVESPNANGQTLMTSVCRLNQRTTQATTKF